MIFLYIVYIFFMLLGLFMAIVGILHEYSFINSLPILVKAIIGSFGIALVGSSIFYSRKLYKLSIGTDITFPQSDEDSLIKTGIFMYFLLRPFFSLCFSFLLILALKTSILIVSVKDTTLDSGFIYLTMFLSFFAGFSSGDILSVLEDVGKKKMEKFFSSQE